MSDSIKDYEIDLDNYFNNVDLGMMAGKVVGHKKYIKSLVEKQILKAKIEEVHSWVDGKSSFESVHVISMKEYVQSLEQQLTKLEAGELS